MPFFVGTLFDETQNEKNCSVGLAGGGFFTFPRLITNVFGGVEQLLPITLFYETNLAFKNYKRSCHINKIKTNLPCKLRATPG